MLAVATLVVSLLMTGITFVALNGIQRDALFPAITATGSANKQRASGDLTDPGRPRIAPVSACRPPAPCP